MMSSSTPDESDNGGKRQDLIRDAWKKLVECEERLTFWRNINDRGWLLEKLNTWEKILDKNTGVNR